jgi:hypothetical protein
VSIDNNDKRNIQRVLLLELSTPTILDNVARPCPNVPNFIITLQGTNVAGD